MGTSALIVAISAGIAGGTIPDKVIQKQEQTFQRYWGTDFVWKFDELPAKGNVPKHRVPYSGFIYPDRGGGTTSAMRKYDLAYHRGRSAAASWERWDTSPQRNRPSNQRFGAFLFGPRRVPHWYGHCNGWTAAAIRHAEPTKSVRRNGVVFTPADIKGLLAEIYIYNETLNVAGSSYTINPGTFHAIIGNWLGRGLHPVGMEADPGEEKWNYPIYAYAYSSAKRQNNQVEVKINLAYAKDSNGEYNESPRARRVKYFHYTLSLNQDGEIIGGYFHRDSAFIDLLWIPVNPKQGGQRDNERGNPYVNVKEVLAIWRASVDEDVRKKWPVIDLAPEDQILDVGAIEGLVPVQSLVKAREAQAAIAAKEAESDETDTEPVAAKTAGEPASDETANEPASAETAGEPAAAETGSESTTEEEPASERVAAKPDAVELVPPETTAE